MNIGQRLKDLRGADVSTKELDKLSGVSPGTVWAIEKSQSGNAQAKTLAPISRVLGVSLDYLIRGDGERPTREAIRAALDAARAECSREKAGAA